MTQTSPPALTGAQPSGLSSGLISSLTERLKAKTAQEAGEIQQMTQNELQLLQSSLSALSNDAERSMRDAMGVQVDQVQRLLSNRSSQIQTAMANTTTAIVIQAQGLQETLTGAENLLKKALRTGASKIDLQTDQLASKLDKTNETIRATLDKTAGTIQSQQSQIRQELRKQTKTLLWLLKLPMLILVGTMVLLCLAVLLLTWAYLPTELFQAKTIVRQFSDGNYLVITTPEWKICKMRNDQYAPCKKVD